MLPVLPNTPDIETKEKTSWIDAVLSFLLLLFFLESVNKGKGIIDFILVIISLSRYIMKERLMVKQYKNKWIQRKWIDRKKVDVKITGCLDSWKIRKIEVPWIGQDISKKIKLDLELSKVFGVGIIYIVLIIKVSWVDKVMRENRQNTQTYQGNTHKQCQHIEKEGIKVTSKREFIAMERKPT